MRIQKGQAVVSLPFCTLSPYHDRPRGAIIRGAAAADQFDHYKRDAGKEGYGIASGRGEKGVSIAVR